MQPSPPCIVPTSGWKIAEALNGALVEDLRGKLGRARYFSITADTSTSSGGKDLLDVELHLWTRGKKEVFFGKLVRIFPMPALPF